MRTPLNAILGWVQLLETGELPPERVRQALAIVGRNAALQAQLIEDMLDVSRIVAGTLGIEHVPVFVPHLIDAVAAGFAPAAQAKRIDLRTTVPDGLPPIDGDPRRLHQVLGNVLSNTIKFTPEGGRVEIDCAVRGDGIEIEVRDSGIGIAPDFLPYLFERFRQADSRSTRAHGGLGLGLAIARHLLEEHGGTIAADSPGNGQGTGVLIRLPIGLSAEIGAGRPRVDEAAVEVRLDGATVVVVDDQRDSRELLAALLERAGASVVECDSAASALEALGTAPVQLLIADIAMPDIDGLELMRRIRQRRIAVPAIAVSAYARAEDRQRAVASGYRGYCPKPVDASRLLRMVRDTMARS